MLASPATVNSKSGAAEIDCNLLPALLAIQSCLLLLSLQKAEGGLGLYVLGVLAACP